MNYVASLAPSCTGSTGSIGGISTAYIQWHCNSLSYLLSLRSPIKVVLLHGLHSLSSSVAFHEGANSAI